MPDPIPKEYLITQAIETRLKTIDGEDGFNLDFNNRVKVWETNWQIEEGHAISIFTGDTNSQDAPRERRKTVHQLPVMIEARLKATTDDETGVDTTYLTAQQAIADIKKAILGTGAQSNSWLAERWPDGNGIGLVMLTEETGHAVLKQENSFEIIGVQVRIMVHFITGKFDSYG